MAAYELKYTAEEIDGILESVDEKTIYDDATQSEHGLMSAEDKTKVDAIPENPQYTDTTYTAGEGINIEDNVISATGGGGGGEQIQSDWNQTDNTKVDYIKNKPTIPDVSGKADKVSNPTSGNFAALDGNGNLTDSGSKASDFLTQHQDLSNYVQKSQTAGLLKNDGTVDTTQYGTYSKPANGIPASDLESGVIPTVPTISTSVTDDASSDTMTSSPKSVKTYVDNICGNILTILESI